MTMFLRSSLAALLAVFCLTFSAQAQQAAPGEPNGGSFPSLNVEGPSPVMAPDAEIPHTQWTSGTPMPEGKEWHAVAQLDGKIYTFGGYVVQGTSLVGDASSYVYDPSTDKWSPIKDFPSANTVHNVAHAVNGKIYIFGGCEYNGSIRDYVGSSIVYEYDPATDSYSLMSSMPSTQFFFGSGVIDNKIVVFGGRSATAYLKLVQVYDPAEDEWSTNFDFPIAAMDIGSASVDNKIVTAGGYSNQGNYRSCYVGEFDGNGNLLWTQIDAYPLSFIRYPCGAGLDGVAYFTGGYSVSQVESATQYTFGYDLGTSTWQIYEKKITGIQNSQIVADMQQIYAVGGELAGRYATNACEMFDPTQEGPLAAVVTPDRLLITATTADGQKNSKMVTVESEGLKEVTWDAAVDNGATWISFATETGTVSSYLTDQIEVFVDPAEMQAGENVGSITVTTNDPLNPTYTVEVRGYRHDGIISVDKNVLIEEFSGTWCGWCPDGVDTLKALEARWGDRINVVTYHNGQNDPMVTSAGNAVMSYLGVSAFPTASIDRMRFPGESGIPISRAAWAPGMRTIFDNIPGIVDIQIVNKNYSEDTKQMSLTAEVTFLQAAQGDFRINMIQTTNQRNFAQTDYTPNTHTAFPYFHDHVVMSVLPNPAGARLGDDNIIMPGTKYTYDFSFTSLDSIPALSDLTFFVYDRISDQQSGPIMQSHSELLLNNVVSVQDPMVAGSFALEQNYPNPFNPATTIRFNVPHTAQVKLVVTDILGREVQTLVNDVKTEGTHTVVFDASRLQSGTYFMTMTSGNFIETKSMTLMK